MKSLLVIVFLFLLCSVACASQEPVRLPEEQIVTSSQKDIENDILLSPGTVTVIRPEEMKGENKSLPELLKRVPGLHVIESKGRGAYTVASVRGGTGAQVAVYVDGILMNLGSEAAVDLSAIPVDNIERIEVYRGYIPARFGGASMGGVINIITKLPLKREGSLSLGAGSYGLFKSNLAYTAPLGKGNFMLGVNFERVDNDFEYWNDNGTPYNFMDDYNADRQNNGYKKADVLLKWNDEHWRLLGTWKKNDRDLVYEAAGADKPDSVPGAHQKNDQWNFSAERRQKSGELDWGWKVDFLDQKKDYTNSHGALTGGWWEEYNTYRTKRYGGKIDGAIAVGKNQYVEFMGDYAYEKLDVDGDIVKTFGGISKFSRSVWNVQAQDTFTLNKAGDLLLTPILRYNAADGEGKLSWGAALTKTVGESWVIKASVGKYNRAPNLYELYGDGAFLRPSTGLEWEDGTQWDLGATWKGAIKSADVTASLTYFGRKSNNLIESVMVSSRSSQYQNIGSAKIHGIELESAAQIDKWKFSLSGTWMKSENETEGSSAYGKQLPNRPKWEGLFRVTRSIQKDDAGSLFAELHYIGENYFNVTETVKMDDLITLGLGAKILVRENLKLTLGVDDVFNSQPDARMTTVYNGPERIMWYPLQGRTFYATLTWEF